MDANVSGAAAPVVDFEALEKKLKNGSGWFFWIAALSLVNTAMAFGGGDRTFLIGLGVTTFADAVAKGLMDEGSGPAIQYVAIVFDVFVAGLFVGAALLARKRHAWAFVAGMVLYVLDAALCVLLEMWPHAGFHLFALFFLWTGFSALRQLRAAGAPAQAAAAPAMAEPRPNPLVR